MEDQLRQCWLFTSFRVCLAFMTLTNVALHRYSPTAIIYIVLANLIAILLHRYSPTAMLLFLPVLLLFCFLLFNITTLLITANHRFLVSTINWGRRIFTQALQLLAATRQVGVRGLEPRLFLKASRIERAQLQGPQPSHSLAIVSIVVPSWDYLIGS